MFAFDGFYVYSAELFPTVIRYSMARLHSSKKGMNQFESFLTRMRNGIMSFKSTLGLSFFPFSRTCAWQQNCTHVARYFYSAEWRWTMRSFNVQHVQLILNLYLYLLLKLFVKLVILFC